MSKYLSINNLKVAEDLLLFVNEELLKGIDIYPEKFWKGFDKAVHDLAPKNKELIETRNKLQKKIDDWHIKNKGNEKKIDEYKKEKEFDFSKMDASIKKIQDQINSNNLELGNKENEVNKAFIKMESIRAKLDSEKFSKDDLFYEIKEAEMKIAESKIKKTQINRPKK